MTRACLGLQCLFAHSLRKFSMRDWGIEQKWMSVLLPLLLLYNGRCRFCSGVFPFKMYSGHASERWAGPSLWKCPAWGGGQKDQAVAPLARVMLDQGSADARPLSQMSDCFGG